MLNFKEQYELAVDALAEFNNYLEIGDFRRFLLLILNLESGGTEAMLRRLGMAPKDKSTLPYDPEKKVYYTKIMSNFNLKSQLVIYHQADKKTDEFVNKSDSSIITEYLTPFERKNLLPKNFVLITPSVVDYTVQVLRDQNSLKPFCVGVESLYTDLAELITTQNSKFVFVLKQKEHDVVFSMNMSFEPSINSKNSIQYFDVYIDEEQKLRDHTFIRMKKEEVKKGNLEMEFFDEIKDLSHSEMFDSQFTIIVPIKSMDRLD